MPLFRVNVTIHYSDVSSWISEETFIFKSRTEKMVKEYMKYRDERRIYSPFYNAGCTRYNYVVAKLKPTEISKEDVNYLVTLEKKKKKENEEAKRKKIQQEIDELEKQIRNKRRKLNDN